MTTRDGLQNAVRSASGGSSELFRFIGCVLANPRIAACDSPFKARTEVLRQAKTLNTALLCQPDMVGPRRCDDLLPVRISEGHRMDCVQNQKCTVVAVYPISFGLLGRRKLF